MKNEKKIQKFAKFLLTSAFLTDFSPILNPTLNDYKICKSQIDRTYNPILERKPLVLVECWIKTRKKRCSGTWNRVPNMSPGTRIWPKTRKSSISLNLTNFANFSKFSFLVYQSKFCYQIWAKIMQKWPFYGYY